MKVPEGWSKKTLEDIANVSSGGTPSRGKPEYWNGAIPWVTTAEIDFCEIFDTTEKITQDGLNNSSAKLFPIGTVLLAMYGQGKTRGKVAKLGIEATTNQACAAIVFKHNFCVEYYYQYLRSQYDNIRNLSNSGSQENLSGSIVKSIQVPAPPLPEQQKIAQILSTWDKAITTTEQLLANSQHQKKALMQQLLTGKKRLLDEDGVRFSGEWLSKFLGDFCEISTGKSNREDSTSSSGMYTFFDRSQDIRTSNIFLFDAEAVIVAGEGQEFVPKHFSGKFDLHQRTYAIMGFANSWGKFIYFYLGHFNSFLLSQAVGSTVKSLRLPMFQKMPIKLPSLKEQQKIATVLTTADREIELLQTKLEALKQEKKALMQQLLTGKRRVNFKGGNDE